MKRIVEEFKDFAVKGDLIAMAVAFVMALAFVTVVNSLVETIIMPIVGIIFGEPSFNSLTWTVNDSIIYYGSFLTAVVRFLAIALGVFFLVVKPYTALKARSGSGAEAAPAPTEEILLLREIRDGLRR